MMEPDQNLELDFGRCKYALVTPSEYGKSRGGVAVPHWENIRVAMQRL